MICLLTRLSAGPKFGIRGASRALGTVRVCPDNRTLEIFFFLATAHPLNLTEELRKSLRLQMLSLALQQGKEATRKGKVVIAPDLPLEAPYNYRKD
jgi:hypothetical protein